MAEFKDLDVSAANNTARFPENMRTNAVNNQARELEAMIAREFKDRNGSLSSTGSANAYVLAANATLTAYAQGDEFTFKANFANTSAATLNVDSVGAKTIKKAHDQDLVTGDIESGALVRVVYDGTNFQLMSPTGYDPASAVASTAADAVSTAADVVTTNADVVLTNADAASTAADVLLTAADVVSTNADVVTTNADVVLTNADVVSTNADVVSAEAAAGAVAIPFTFDSSTTMADPGTGDFRFNNATVSSVTAITLDANSADTGNPDVSDYIATWGASDSTDKAHIIIKKSGTPATFAVFKITAAVTDNTTHLELTVTHVDSNGTWSASDKGYVQWVRTGDAGTASYVTATTTVEGIVEKSTSAENVAGTATDKWPDVAGTKEMIDTHATSGLASGDVISADDGAVGAPGLTFADDLDNGFYRIGTNNWAGAVACSKFFEVNSSGQVGFNGSPGGGATNEKLYVYNGSSKVAYFEGDGNGEYMVTSEMTHSSGGGGAAFRALYAGSTGSGLHSNATHATYGSDWQGTLELRVDRAANSGYKFLMAQSGGSDREFNLQGNGNGLCDGSWTGGGADYAEFFEWADGNLDEEDRVGLSVVLDGTEKMRPATDADDTSQIIGIISGAPVIVGDAAWNKWTGKHLKDEFNRYLWEEHPTYSWHDADGKFHSYAQDDLPNGLVPPDDVEAVMIERRVVNPDWIEPTEFYPNGDPIDTYVPREDRPEWDTVGLMGKLRLKKGQPTGDRWIKMRDVSADVEEWLVR